MLGWETEVLGGSGSAVLPGPPCVPERGLHGKAWRSSDQPGPEARWRAVTAAPSSYPCWPGHQAIPHRGASAVPCGTAWGHAVFPPSHLVPSFSTPFPARNSPVSGDGSQARGVPTRSLSVGSLLPSRRPYPRNHLGGEVWGPSDFLSPHHSRPTWETGVSHTWLIAAAREP